MSLPSWSASTGTDRFPIPMRGNEYWTWFGATVAEAKFPIPMRGNEVERPAKPSGILSHVSDPHEG